MVNVKDTVEKVYGNYPEKILQFGEGNFLRAFADWMINKANAQGLYKGSIVLCQPIAPGLAKMINDQNGVYTVAMRGAENGQPVERIEKITSVSRCINPYEDYEALMEIARSEDLEVIISNTTEAGISYHAGDKLTDKPPVSYPAKLTAFLYERFKHFGGAMDKGVLILPVELIDDNGGNLKRIVKQYIAEWELGDEFLHWFEEAVHVTSTLVDRIVTGYPRNNIEYFENKLGYQDNIIVTCELFNLWVIEGKKEWADILPIHKTDAHVIWTDDVTPYKKRKVRILNGAHTSTVLAAYLAGHNIVREYMNDEVFAKYTQELLYDEVIPTLDLPKADLEEFAGAVADRFNNPYVDHRLLDISLNSCSKFCARCLPSLLGYVDVKGQLPKLLTFSLAAFIAFYNIKKLEDGSYEGVRPDGTHYPVKDDADVLEFFASEWATGDVAKIAHDTLANTAFWGGKDLTQVPGLEAATVANLKSIQDKGVSATIKELL
ncbi:MAG: tagaturonate reductase [Eubacteriales bacterium]